MKLWHTGLLLAALSLSTTCLAETYRCTTTQGATVFQDKPCSNGSKGGEIQIRSLPNSGVAAPSNTADWRQREQQSVEQRKNKAEAEMKAAEEQSRNNRQLCSNARQSLDVLKNPGAAYRLDQQGKRNYLEDKNRDQEISQLEKQVKEYCDAP